MDRIVHTIIMITVAVSAAAFVGDIAVQSIAHLFGDVNAALLSIN